MDAIDQQIINLIQQNFPLVPKPYEFLANQLGISETEIISMIMNLKKRGIIRRIGASVNSRKIGYTSTLCAMQIGKERIGDTVNLINGYPEVTHNYLREHDYNIWFTIIAESIARRDQIIAEILQKTGQPKFMNLPAVQTFKIAVNFQMAGDEKC